MKTPRPLLAALLAANLAPGARAADATIIPIDLSAAAAPIELPPAGTPLDPSKFQTLTIDPLSGTRPHGRGHEVQLSAPGSMRLATLDLAPRHFLLPKGLSRVIGRVPLVEIQAGRPEEMLGAVPLNARGSRSQMPEFLLFDPAAAQQRASALPSVQSDPRGGLRLLAGSPEAGAVAQIYALQARESENDRPQIQLFDPRRFRTADPLSPFSTPANPLAALMNPLGGEPRRSPLEFGLITDQNEIIVMPKLSGYAWDPRTRKVVAPDGTAYDATPADMRPGRYRLGPRVVNEAEVARLSLQTVSGTPIDRSAPPRAEPVQMRVTTYSGWEDAVTPVERWRKLTPTGGQPVHCYHPALRKGGTLVEAFMAVRQNPVPVPCVDWDASAQDGPLQEGGKTYKIRYASKQGSAVYADGKFHLGGFSGDKVEYARESDPDDIGVEFVKVTKAPNAGERSFPNEAEWLGRQTPVAQWFDAKIGAGTFHCFFGQNRPAVSALEGYMRRNPRGATCVEWREFPTGDQVSGEGETRYKSRVRVSQGKLVYDASSSQPGLVLDMGGPARSGKAPQLSELSLDAPNVLVLASMEDGPAALAALNEGELRWLTKAQKTAYETEARNAAEGDAAEKKRAAVSAARAQVKENIRDEGGSKAAYERALAEGKLAAHRQALLSLRMWGEGDAAKAEIELTAQESEKLKKENAAAFDAYQNARNGIENKEQKDIYDPVALRLSVVAARKALGLGPDGRPAGAPSDARPGEGPGRDAVSDAELTPEELAVLTPSERAQYESSAGAANRATWNRAARERIQRENRLGYKAGEERVTNLKDFDGLPPWRKRAFCAELLRSGGAAAAAAGDRAAPAFDGSGTGRGLADAQAIASRGDAPRPAGQSAGLDPAEKRKIEEACGKLPEEARLPVDAAGPGQGRSNHSAAVPKVGADKEVEEPKKSKGPSDHAYNAMRGGILGALIGSFFGPVGIIVGIAIGAGAMYGVSKWMNPD